MIILDAHLPPGLSTWISDTFEVPCFSANYIGLRDADDVEIFEAARQKNAIVLTKDSGFIELLSRFGSPPKIIWLTCGNTSKARLKTIFEQHLDIALDLLKEHDLVEITGRLI